ncbi:DUF721 domain-containing protein [Corynebacterium heidelbergense]|uniref:DUF721 domain-containing protein n=1 Tax=Corynebacterium heidelbergense TaxID=2055947 RepID=A0A364V870_9CORY|nr:DciA family protein [Corynebacterium heidelbergense]RAV32863.1 DUF721 domain-containing protein [Corynebacterium heidelbergense]
MTDADEPPGSGIGDATYISDPILRAASALRSAGGKGPALPPQPTPAAQTGGAALPASEVSRSARAAGGSSGRLRARAGVRRYRRTRLDGREDRSYRDPARAGSVLSREIRRHGWQHNIAAGRLVQDWSSIVGPEVAAHTHVLAYHEEQRELIVQCDSTPWATQLRYMAPMVLASIAKTVGSGVVEHLQIKNPNCGPKSTGRLRWQGRGKRDDWG